jgi:hypothetical protein
MEAITATLLMCASWTLTVRKGKGEGGRDDGDMEVVKSMEGDGWKKKESA